MSAPSDGAAELTAAVERSFNRTRSSDTENARESSPAVAATGIERWFALAAPGCSSVRAQPQAHRGVDRRAAGSEASGERGEM